MSTVYLKIYRSEEGIHSNPSINSLYDTNCNIDGKVVKKPFFQVLIVWDGDSWNEVTQYVSGAVAAIKVMNECAGGYAYIATNFNDFRLLQLCCQSQAVQGIYSQPYSIQYV